MSSVPVSINPSQLAFYNVQNLTCAQEGPRSVPLRLDFTTVTSYSINLLNVSARQFISEVQAIWFDNSLSNTEFTVYLPLSHQSLTFPAGSQGYVNVLCPNPANLVFSSDGGAVVQVQLLNFPVTNAVWLEQEGSSVQFPQVVATKNLSGQTATQSFNLLDGSQPTGDYLLVDYLSITTPDPATLVSELISWQDDTGSTVFDTSNNNLTEGLTGSASVESLFAFNAFQIFSSSPKGIHAVTGTPITVQITLTPSAIATVSVTAGNAGLLYAPGDTGSIVTGDGNAVYEVLTVGAGGAVLTVSVTTPGTGYSISTGNATLVSTGAGDGNLQLDILTLVPPSAGYSYHATLTRLQ